MTFLLGLFILILAPILMIILGATLLIFGIKVVCYIFGGN